MELFFLHSPLFALYSEAMHTGTMGLPHRGSLLCTHPCAFPSMCPTAWALGRHGKSPPPLFFFFALLLMGAIYCYFTHSHPSSAAVISLHSFVRLPFLLVSFTAYPPKANKLQWNRSLFFSHTHGLQCDFHSFCSTVALFHLKRRLTLKESIAEAFYWVGLARLTPR